MYSEFIHLFLCLRAINDLSADRVLCVCMGIKSPLGGMKGGMNT